MALENLCWGSSLDYQISVDKDSMCRVSLTDEFQTIHFVGSNTPEMVVKACAFIDFRRCTDFVGFDHPFDDDVNNMKDHLGINNSAIN